MNLFASLNPLRRAALVACLGVTSVTAPFALAQDQQKQRIVQGRVVDKGDQPLKGATVYLKDQHTLAVKSYISTEDGSYRFGQLTQNTDYELWAEADGKKSGTKNISSFDTRAQFNITLKIEK